MCSRPCLWCGPGRFSPRFRHVGWTQQKQQQLPLQYNITIKPFPRNSKISMTIPNSMPSWMTKRREKHFIPAGRLKSPPHTGGGGRPTEEGIVAQPRKRSQRRNPKCDDARLFGFPRTRFNYAIFLHLCALVCTTNGLQVTVLFRSNNCVNPRLLPHSLTLLGRPLHGCSPPLPHC